MVTTSSMGSPGAAQREAAKEGQGPGAFARMTFEHEQLTRSLARLLDYVSASDHLLAREEWDVFEQSVLRHMDAEELYLLPEFKRHNAAEAAALLSEHRTIRELVANIGLSFELHIVRAPRIEELRLLLQQHAKREARALYPWADAEAESGRARLPAGGATGLLLPSTPERAAAILLGLVETCGDGERGYRRAAAETKDDGYRIIFTKYADERGRLAAELLELLSRSGLGAHVVETSALGTLHRGWLEAAAVIGRGRPGGILRECIRGEDAALRNYRAAMRAGLPPGAQEMVQEQYEVIRRAEEELRSLRAMESEQQPRTAPTQ